MKNGEKKKGKLTEKYVIGVIEDITERKRAEAELNRFFDLSMDILAIGDGYLKRIDPAVEKIMGYSISEFLGTPWIEFIHPEDQAASKAEVERVLAGSPTTEFENRFRSKEGDYKWLAWMARAIPTEGLFYRISRYHRSQAGGGGEGARIPATASISLLLALVPGDIRHTGDIEK